MNIDEWNKMMDRRPSTHIAAMSQSLAHNYVHGKQLEKLRLEIKEERRIRLSERKSRTTIT